MNLGLGWLVQGFDGFGGKDAGVLELGKGLIWWFIK